MTTKFNKELGEGVERKQSDVRVIELSNTVLGQLEGMKKTWLESRGQGRRD
jgi:hypothetical protein